MAPAVGVVPGVLVDAVALVDGALLRGMVTRPELEAALAGAPSSRRTPAVRRVLGLTDARAESWPESAWRVHHMLAGLPAPQLQVEIRVDGQLI